MGSGHEEGGAGRGAPEERGVGDSGGPQVAHRFHGTAAAALLKRTEELKLLQTFLQGKAPPY